MWFIFIKAKGEAINIYCLGFFFDNHICHHFTINTFINKKQNTLIIEWKKRFEKQYTVNIVFEF